MPSSRAATSKARRAFSGGRSRLTCEISGRVCAILSLFPRTAIAIKCDFSRVPSPAVDMPIDPAIDYHAWPDASGHFGRHGGRFVAETLIGPLEELAAAYDAARVDPAFIEAFETDLAHYVGRPSPIYEAARLTDHVGGARILLKREDLNHTGAHKINNTIGQALLASRMGKTRIIAETGAGQHGVASATVAARLGRSEEHTSELQSLMRISYAVFCLKKK